jgi:nucleoside-diphosphate-sugar epimerase
MDKPSVFITGATGFVGAAMLRYFAGNGWEVTGSSRGAAPVALQEKGNYLQADIAFPMPAQIAEVVIHSAALASDTAAKKDLWQANVVGTQHVYEATRVSKVFVFISSSSVYDGRREIHVEDEAVDPAQLSAYGQTKRAAEDWLLQQDWRTRTLVILRPRAIYGVGDRVLLPRLLNTVRRGRIVVPGDMRVQSSLTHVGNLCRAADRSIAYCESQPGGSHIFNVADANPYEMRTAVQQLLSAVTGETLAIRSLPLSHLYFLAGLAERFHIQLSLSRLALHSVSRNNVLELRKIRETLGFEPEHHLEAAIADIAHWAKQVGLEQLRQARADLPWRV